MSIQRGPFLKSWAKWRRMCWIASQDILLMPDGLCEIGPEKETLHKHYCLPVPLLVRRLSLTHQHHAKLDYSGRGDTIPSLSQLLQPPWLDHKLLLSSVSGRYNDPPGDWPPWLTAGGQPCLSWVRAVEAGGWRASCWCGGRSRIVDSGTWPWPAPLLWGQIWSPEDRGPLQRKRDEQLFTGAEPGAVSGSALTTGDRAGQPGQAPAAGHRSESESRRAH